MWAAFVFYFLIPVRNKIDLIFNFCVFPVDTEAHQSDMGLCEDYIKINIKKVIFGA